MRSIKLSDDAAKDLKLLRKESANLVAKLWDLLLNIDETPYTGLGHPEPLKGNLSGAYSRIIDKKHRLVYVVTEDEIKVISCHGHYGDK